MGTLSSTSARSWGSCIWLVLCLAQELEAHTWVWTDNVSLYSALIYTGSWSTDLEMLKHCDFSKLLEYTQNFSTFTQVPWSWNNPDMDCAAEKAVFCRGSEGSDAVACSCSCHFKFMPCSVESFNAVFSSWTIGIYCWARFVNSILLRTDRLSEGYHDVTLNLCSSDRTILVQDSAGNEICESFPCKAEGLLTTSGLGSESKVRQ